MLVEKDAVLKTTLARAKAPIHRCRASHCSRVVMVVVPEKSWYKKVGTQGARPILRSDVNDQQFATTTFTEPIVGEGFILVG